MSDRCTIDVALVLAMAPVLLPVPGHSAKSNKSGDNTGCVLHVPRTQSLMCRSVGIPPSELTVQRMTSGVTVAVCNSHMASLVACVKRFSQRCYRRIMAWRHYTASGV
jgi:hypothetical protein